MKKKLLNLWPLNMTGQIILAEGFLLNLQELNQLIRTELSWQQLEQPMITIYSSVFTEEELQGIITFYQSDAGQKMVKRQPELMQASMAVMQEQSMLLMPKIKQLSEKQLKERMARQQAN